MPLRLDDEQGVMFEKIKKQMKNTYPCIKVIDIETSIEWYIDFLGFQCTYKSSIKNPISALIEKDEQKIYLIKSENREVYASNVILIEVPDIKAEYKTLDNGKILFAQHIEKGLFSDTEFIIKDYEDNKIIYKQKT